MFSGGEASASVQLLRQLRDVMAGEMPAQEKLDLVVTNIAGAFHADVCSVYALRAGDVLELFATQGLNKASIHSARLSVGQGLVGEIAAQGQPLNLSDAQHHPSFVYLPITGEEIYNAFLGVPLVRGGKAIGVLVVQQRESRVYPEEAVELLQTVAMVVAELVGAGELVQRQELEKGTTNKLFSQHFVGIRLAPGIARGMAVVHESKIEIHKFVADDPEKEHVRFNEALHTMRQSLDEIVESSSQLNNDELTAIIEAYRLFAYDQGWIDRIHEAIESGLTAEAAVKMAQDQLKMKLERSGNQYLIERIHDIEDLGNRLMHHLSGNTKVSFHAPLNEDFILVARHLGPGELFDYDKNRLKGLILEDGSATSHVVIIARALDIPVVGRVRNCVSIITTGEQVIVNGDGGEVYINPTGDVERAITNYLRQQEEKRQYFASHRDKPAVTLDGVNVSVNMNAGLFIDIKQLHEAGADGIGLYRTELPYMMAKYFPTVESQTEMYSQVLEQANGKRVVFRTFDIGGDKQVPYLRLPQEENPAMGWRATRIGLDRPSILRRQLRALLRAGVGHTLHVMFPFITEVVEFDEAKKLLDAEIALVKATGGTLPDAIKIGTMIEIPAIIWQLDALLPKLDFVSIGSNDLMQFLYACDRNSPAVADRYDIVSPAILSVMEHILSKCTQYNVDVGFCGEMASKPLEAMCLLALGFRSLSMPASSIGPIKAMVRSVQLVPFTNFLQQTRAGNLPLRSSIRAYAQDRGIRL